MEFRLLLHEYQLLVIKSYTAVLRFAAQPASGNNLLLVSAAIGQLSATGVTGTKQQYGGCNPQEVKVYGGCGPHEVNVLGNHSQAVKVLTVFNKRYTSKTLHFSDFEL